MRPMTAPDLPAWSDAPTRDGWYVVRERIAQFSDVYLVRVEGSRYHDEIGRIIAKPEEARWLGPVEAP